MGRLAGFRYRDIVKLEGQDTRDDSAVPARCPPLSRVGPAKPTENKTQLTKINLIFRLRIYFSLDKCNTFESGRVAGGKVNSAENGSEYLTTNTTKVLRVTRARHRVHPASGSPARGIIELRHIEQRFGIAVRDP